MTIIFSQTLTSPSTGWQGYNIRQLLDSSELSAAPGSTSVRVTLQFTSGTSGTLNEAWIGELASTYNFDGNQVQLTFGGANSVAVSGTTTLVSDSVAFTYTGTGNSLVVSLYGSGSEIDYNHLPGTADNHYYLLGASQAGVTAPTGSWTLEASELAGVTLVEALSVTGPAANPFVNLWVPQGLGNLR